ncbi:MAG: SgcJ/EcaC family oxidoreductase [Novosphingobium sp.]
MKSIFAIAPVMAAAALVATVAPAQAKAKATCARLSAAQLDAKFAQFNGAWATGNPDTVTKLFDEDAVLLATVANVPRTDPAGIRDYFVSFLKNKPVGKVDSATIKSGCNWALQAGTWTVTLTDPASGAKNDVKARYTFLYQFEDGKWRIEHLHSSAMPQK